MSRSVVLKGAPRCPRCQLPPRWCICAGLQPVATPLRTTVLMHFMESYRPSSTGHLIGRIVHGARVHEFRKESAPTRAEVVDADRELWILHPQGEDPPATSDPAKLQVLLLDGTWVQATEMAHQVGLWGRRVRLPMTGESRYWLRRQAGEGRFSTMEALLFLHEALGLTAEHERLRAQFELHVWAALCSRGHKADAQRYLATSPARAAFADLIAQLTTPRPRQEEGRSFDRP
ncbi:MAG: DTW domain-containing protein [Opitutus sp.]|nr:DTW domain-containing protein [Opitutus sp.]